MTQLLIPHPTPVRASRRPGLLVDVVSPAPRDIWRGLVRDDPGATALQTPKYFDAVLAGTRGEDASRFYQLADGRQLVLPLVRTRSPLGRVEAAYPGGYGPGGMLATGGLLADDVRTVLPDLRGRSRSLRIGGAHHTGDQWAAGVGPGVVEEPRRVEVIELDRDYSGRPQAYLPRETRQLLRQAARDGVEVERDTTGRLIPVCYDLYRTEIERRGRAGIATSGNILTFATVAAYAGEACRVFVGWRQGRPVAASIMLVHGQHATSWGTYATEEPARPVAAGLLTQVAAVEDAIRSGCRSIDLGPSPGMAGRPRYSSSLGAESRSVVDLWVEPAGLRGLRSAKARTQGVLRRARTRSSAGSIPGQPSP